MNVHQVHFVLAQKGYTFKLEQIMGPYIVNNRQALKQVEEMMKELGLNKGERWQYDPHHIISDKRMKIIFAPFTH